MPTIEEYQKWHLENDHVPRRLSFRAWCRKMGRLEEIEAKLAKMRAGSETYGRMDAESTRLCEELGL